MRLIRRLPLGLGLLVFVSGGCVHVMTLHRAYVDPAINPPHGPTVTIVKVTDGRQFEPDPKDIQTPTVQHRKDINNSKVTDRAIGKARNNGHTIYFQYSKHDGDTVETAVDGAVANAFRNKGYIVVPNDSAAAARAIPVEVTIDKYWAWWKEGFWTIETQFHVEVNVASPAVLDGKSATASGSHEVHSAYMVSSITRNCVRDALNDLTFDLQPKLKKP